MRLTDILSESDAADLAKKRGLISKGWGRWYDKQGKYVAKTVDGKLKFIFQNEPKKSNSLEKSINDTASFAIHAHGDQSYGDKPYSYHLKKVYDNAVRFGGSMIARKASILHDVLEDTNITKPELIHEFGSDVANIVDLVSNQPSKEETLKRIRSNPEAVFVKLCDRLANVSEGGKLEKYRKEYPLFKSVLYRRGEYDSLWHELDKKLGVSNATNYEAS